MQDSGTESDDDFCIFPITDLHMDTDSASHSDKSSEAEEEEKNVVCKGQKRQTLRQRRLSKSYNQVPLKALNVHKAHWLHAIRKAKTMADPWREFHIENFPTEVCVRHRYNALKKEWCKDEVKVKMDGKPFTRGAMRECFRLVKMREGSKKLSNFTMNEDWTHSYNYVAKRYIEAVDKSVYFEDVKLQMDAKLWGEEYNRHNPPKKVDIFQMYILEFKERPDKPLYHLEHYIEGDYVKYNSNSGFVEENLRLTPQAFSHFTFERSGHQLIVVDIQGVGDLYTDPQIHTVGGAGYGDGNLGEKGMALFFHSHVCNSICRKMSLTEFDLSPTEIEMHKSFMEKQMKMARTCVRGEVEACVSASPKERVDLTHLLHPRTLSGCSLGSTSPPTSPPFSPISTDTDEPMSIDSPVGPCHIRIRYTSESEHSVTDEEERAAFFRSQAHKARPSSVFHELQTRRDLNLIIGDSVLGQIHHEMAKYHELGRFSASDVDVDWKAALYHEEHAAELGVLEAILTLARLYLGLQHDVLVNCSVQSTEDNINSGVDYMMQAALAGDRSAMIFMARAFQTGNNLGTLRERSWEDAVHWFQQALEKNDHDEGGEYDATMDDPAYLLQEAIASMYMKGGFGLTADPEKASELYNEAAESAMEAMKGKLASKFYMLAEECQALVMEEE